MSGDLEDFLRRAAQRRQAKAGQQQPPPPRQRPQHSDRRTERIVRPVEADEILTAEIVEEEELDSFQARLRRVEEAKQAAAKAQAEAAQRLKKAKTGRAKSSGVAPALSGHPAHNIIRMLQQPGGIQQAILLREILDRPEHRW